MEAWLGPLLWFVAWAVLFVLYLWQGRDLKKLAKSKVNWETFDEFGNRDLRRIERLEQMHTKYPEETFTELALRLQESRLPVPLNPHDDWRRELERLGIIHRVPSTPERWEAGTAPETKPDYGELKNYMRDLPDDIPPLRMPDEEKHPMSGVRDTHLGKAKPK